MKDRCQKFRAQMPRALMSDLEPTGQAELEQHLAECDACRQEQAEYLATIQELKSVEDVDLPRHFVLGPEVLRPTLRDFLAGLAWPWKLATAGAALAMLLLVGLSLSNLQLKAHDGVYAFSFGRPIPDFEQGRKTAEELQALRVELRAFVRESLENERRAYQVALQTEVGRSSQQLTADQRQLLTLALAEVETRLTDRILTGDTLLKNQTRESLAAFYEAVQTQRAQDLLRIRSTMSQAALESEANDRQTREVLSTLLDVADLRVREIK